MDSSPLLHRHHDGTPRRDSKDIANKRKLSPTHKLEDIRDDYARKHGVDLSSHDWSRVNPMGARWDFIRVCQPNLGTHKDDDVLTTRLNLISCILIIISVIVMMISLNIGYSYEDGVYVYDPVANGFKIAGSVLTFILIVLTVYQKIHILKVDVTQADTTLNIHSVRHIIHRDFWLSFIFEVCLLVCHPLPYMTSSWANQMGIMVIFRLGYTLRVLRDNLHIYKKRRQIRHEPHLLLYAEEGHFTVFMALRYMFTYHAAKSFASLVVCASLLLSFCFMIAERDHQPDLSYGMWVYLVLISMTVVGNDSVEIESSIGHLLMLFTLATGLTLGALVINSVSEWLTPSEQEKQVIEWLESKRNHKLYYNTAASLVQETWRYYHENQIRRRRKKTREEEDEKEKGGYIHGDDDQRRLLGREDNDDDDDDHHDRRRRKHEAIRAFHIQTMRRLRLKRNWSLINSFKPLRMEMDTLLNLVQDMHNNVSNMHHQHSQEGGRPHPGPSSSVPSNNHEENNTPITTTTTIESSAPPLSSSSSSSSPSAPPCPTSPALITTTSTDDTSRLSKPHSSSSEHGAYSSSSSYHNPSSTVASLLPSSSLPSSSSSSSSTSFHSSSMNRLPMRSGSLPFSSSSSCRPYYNYYQSKSNNINYYYSSSNVPSNNNDNSNGNNNSRDQPFHVDVLRRYCNKTPMHPFKSFMLVHATALPPKPLHYAPLLQHHRHHRNEDGDQDNHHHHQHDENHNRNHSHHPTTSLLDDYRRLPHQKSSHRSSHRILHQHDNDDGINDGGGDGGRKSGPAAGRTRGTPPIN